MIYELYALDATGKTMSRVKVYKYLGFARRWVEKCHTQKFFCKVVGTGPLPYTIWAEFIGRDNSTMVYVEDWENLPEVKP